MARKAPTTGPRDVFVRVRVTSEQREELRRIAAEDGATESEALRRLIAEEVRRRSTTRKASK